MYWNYCQSRLCYGEKDIKLVYNNDVPNKLVSLSASDVFYNFTIIHVYIVTIPIFPGCCQSLKQIYMKPKSVLFIH